MTIEIELKFIATPESAEKLPTSLAAWPNLHSAPQKLTNIYFETAERQLRRWDMGLRIRGFGDSYEMTLKAAGQTVGGLHQRPEYNVPLQEPVLAIDKLPAEIWPQSCDLQALQAQLKPLFSTHFVREKWVVTYLNSEIEVALDRGEVQANELSEPLNEIELELKKGERAELLAFAAELAEMGGLRLGSLSKAARGYQLAQGQTQAELRPLPILKTRPKATVEEGMRAAFTLALSQWQHHEELWMRGTPAALKEIHQALETLRQAFSLFGTLVPRKASSELRQQLAALQDKLSQEKLQPTLCFTPLWLQTQLALTNWIASDGWRSFMDAKSDSKLQGSFKRFCDIMLGRLSADLKETFSRVRQVNEYQDKLARLQHQLLAARLLAGAYSEADVTSWLELWEQLAHAIKTHQEAWLETYRQQALKQPVFWKNGSA